ncbi:MAG: quinolinate synthase NadA [Syntrophomonadaceae bacterium]
MENLVELINKRKREINGIIIAHYYQLPEIQDVADFVGDSLQMARQAADTDADVIVVCGVRFMAESAKILSPEKTVILPQLDAGCPLADTISARDLKELKDRHPDAVVVCYVNSSAEVKAESDICCTSANAVQVVQSIPEDKTIIFVPDRNLGAYVQEKTGRDMILWQGCCPVHDALRSSQVEEQMKQYQDTELLVHPECRPEVTQVASKVCSTGGMLKYVKDSSCQRFIIGTEKDFLYSLKKQCPDKEFILAPGEFECPDMKLISLSKLAQAMATLENKIEIPVDIQKKAYQSVKRMLDI